MAADDTQTFTVKLDDGITDSASSASDALGKLQRSIAADQKALNAMNASMRAMKSAGLGASAQAVQLGERMDAQKKKIGEAQQAYLELGGTFRSAAAKTPKKEFDALGAALGKMPPNVAAVARNFGSLGGALAAGAVVGGLLAIAAALAAVTMATLAAGAALIQYGFAAAGARRDEGLRLEGLTHLRRGMRQVGGDAGEMQASIDRVNDSTSASRSTLEGYVATLNRMGVRGANMDQALEAMAIRGEVLGERYAQSFAMQAAGAVRAGRSVADLAQKVRNDLGGIAARRALSLGVQMAKLKSNFDALFRGLRIEGPLRMFSELVKLFSQSRDTGRALGDIFERMLNPLFDSMDSNASTVRSFFEGMVLGALKVEEGILQMRNAFLRLLINNAPLRALWNRLREGADMAKVGYYAFLALATTMALLAGSVTVLAVVVGGLLLLMAALAIAPFAIVAAFGYLVVRIVQSAQEMGIRVGTALASLMRRGMDAGRNLMTGLAAGITSGLATVITAIQRVSGSTTDALKESLEIHSPSRVFARLGMEIPRGLAVGVDAGADAAASSVASMVDVSVGAAGATAAGPTTNSTASSISMGDIYVMTQATDAPGIAADLRQEFAKILEGLMAQRGVPA